MTQALYLNILQDGVMKTIDWHHFNPSHVIFQHDNDPKYTTKLLKQWLSMLKFGCTYLASSITWPKPNFVWAFLKRKLNEYPTPAKGMIPLWEHVQASFHSIIPEKCQKFYHSMFNRIQVVVASQGGWPNY